MRKLTGMSRAVPPRRLETRPPIERPGPNLSTNGAGFAPGIPLLDHVRQEPDEPRPLDRLGELALLLGRHRRDAARHDLAALGDVAAEQAHVLVIDLRCLVAGEGAGLAAAMEGPAGRDGGNLGHGSALLGGGCRGRGSWRFAIALARRARAARSTVAIAAFAVSTEATASAATAAEAATTTAAITATEAATATAAEAATIAPEPAAAIAVASPLVAVGLAHLDGGLGLVLVDADGDEADDVGREAHAALHLGNRRRRCVEVHERVVRLAVLLDLERDGLETPIFCFADLAAAFGDDVAVFFRQRLDLRLTD